MSLAALVWTSLDLWKNNLLLLDSCFINCGDASYSVVKIDLIRLHYLEQDVHSASYSTMVMARMVSLTDIGVDSIGAELGERTC